jgi:hypothetical protein
VIFRVLILLKALHPHIKPFWGPGVGRVGAMKLKELEWAILEV